MSTKHKGNGPFGIKIVYQNGDIVYMWNKDESKRDSEYAYALKSKATRVAAGVQNHQVTKVNR